MSQTEPQEYRTDVVHTLPIDEAGELARFSVAGGPGWSRASLIEIQIEGDEAASYHLEFGSRDADGLSTHWFEADTYQYESTASIEDAWQQSRRHIRIVIDTPASAGSEARVIVANGRMN